MAIQTKIVKHEEDNVTFNSKCENKQENILKIIKTTIEKTTGAIISQLTYNSIKKVGIF